MIRAIAAVLALFAALTACGGGTAPSTPQVVTVTAQPAAEPAAAAPTTPAVTRVTLPEVKGRNGGIVYDELRDLGLTNVSLASRDDQDRMVLAPQNWTAVKIEPAAGTEIDSNDTVVVTMTKK